MDLQMVMGILAFQVAVIGMLFRWQHVQIRDNKLEVSKVSLRTYSKEEANEAINLRQKPIEVGIAHVQDEIKEVKRMIGRLLDEKNQG